jgi:hypothetical protein
MVKKRRHTQVEIAAKLARADYLATRGAIQKEIARELGVTVMTLHRWRRIARADTSSQLVESSRLTDEDQLIAQLRLENSRTDVAGGFDSREHEAGRSSTRSNFRPTSQDFEVDSTIAIYWSRRARHQPWSMPSARRTPDSFLRLALTQIRARRSSMSRSSGSAFSESQMHSQAYFS